MSGVLFGMEIFFGFVLGAVVLGVVTLALYKLRRPIRWLGAFTIFFVIAAGGTIALIIFLSYGVEKGFWPWWVAFPLMLVIPVWAFLRWSRKPPQRSVDISDLPKKDLIG